MVLEFDALNVSVNDEQLGLVTLETITEEKGVLFDTIGSYCGEPDGDSNLQAKFKLDADFSGDWDGHLEFEVYLVATLAADGATVTSWSGTSVVIALQAARLNEDPIQMMADTIDAKTVQNATGKGFFASRSGYGYECDGEQIFGSTKNTNEVELVMINTRFQAFNMNSSEVSPGPSGVLDNCTPRADPTVTVVAAVVGTVAALALVAALATFVYRRKTRGAYARLSA